MRPHPLTCSLTGWLAGTDCAARTDCPCLCLCGLTVYVYVPLGVCVLCVGVSLSVSRLLGSVSVCVRVLACPVLFRSKPTRPDLCLLLSHAHRGEGTWGCTRWAAETELERPRGRRSPAVAAVVWQKQELQQRPVRGAVAYASQPLGCERHERRLD